MSRIKKDNRGYVFVAPFFIVLAVFVVYPILFSFVLSFHKWDGSLAPMQYIGLDNFKKLVSDSYFTRSITNTWIMWICNIIPQMIFGLGLAAILSERRLKGKAIFRWFYYLPNIVTMASVGVLFYFLLDWKTGSINALLMKLGLISEPVNWLQNIGYTRGAVSFTLWWIWFGYTMIIFMAGIKAIPEDLFEAARVDGANKWQVFWRITLPSLRPVMLYQIVTSLIGGMTMFDVPYVLTGGNGSPQASALTMVMYLYNTAFQNYNLGYGAAIGVGLFLMIVVFVVIAFRLMKRRIANE